MTDYAPSPEDEMIERIDAAESRRRANEIRRRIRAMRPFERVVFEMRHLDDPPAPLHAVATRLTAECGWRWTTERVRSVDERVLRRLREWLRPGECHGAESHDPLRSVLALTRKDTALDGRVIGLLRRQMRRRGRKGRP